MGTTPPIFQAVSALLVAAVRRRPFLLEVRDLWPEFAIGMQVLTNPVLIRLSRWLERFLYRHATHLLVNSPAYRDYLEGKGIPASRITLIPNGVDPDMFAPDDTAPGIRREFSIETAFVVTYAGALGLANDVDCILGAAAHLRDTHPSVVFLLAGDGKERTRLEDAARRDQLTNVRFAGSRPKSQMKAILAASDACVATLQPIPMFTTTYPNKVFDYMAAGRPTILAIDGVIRTVIEDCRGGLFVPPGDPLALAEAVATLCTDRNAARAMGRRARDHVVKHFNRHDHARLFSTLIRSLARP